MTARLKKPLFWLVVAFAVYAILKRPDQAAGLIGTGKNGLVGGVSSLGQFFDAVLSS
jgi:hypothetical protein